MAYKDKFRLSSHAVITDADDKVLLLKANYGGHDFGLPGGALEPGETIHQALQRECLEELGLWVSCRYLSGVYYHSAYDSQAFIFRCDLGDEKPIKLSDEHSEYEFVSLDDLSAVQKIRVQDCLQYSGAVISRRF